MFHQSLCVIVAIPVFLLLPLFDLVEASVSSRQRGDVTQILKKGSGLTVSNLGLVGKLAGFIHITLLCLFTDQRKSSISIPLVNDRNVDTAMKSILSINQQSYIVRLEKDVTSEIKNFPKEWESEIKQSLKEEIGKSRVFRLLISQLEKRKEIREKVMQTFRRTHSKHAPDWTVFGINEKGVSAFAMIRKPPPTFMTRMMIWFWCSDPNVKERIIEEIEKLESGK